MLSENTEFSILEEQKTIYVWKPFPKVVFIFKEKDLKKLST